MVGCRDGSTSTETGSSVMFTTSREGMMVNQIDRPNRTPIGPMVLSLTFKVWPLRVYLLTTSPFCLKGWEGLFSYFSKHRLILYKVPLCHKDILKIKHRKALFCYKR